jgi:hypothetical protein
MSTHRALPSSLIQENGEECSFDQRYLYSRAMLMIKTAFSLGLALVTLGFAVLLTGCGGGGSSSSSTARPASVAATTAGSASKPSTESQPAKEPSAAFLTKEKHSLTNYAAEFGEEASPQEREAIGKLVAKSLVARAAGDFKTQCETLNKQGLSEIPGAKNHRDCAAALTKYATPLAGSREARKDTLSGPIAALRINKKHDKAFALYHGNDGKNWAAPLKKEGGEWKLSAIVMTEI